MTKAAEHLHIAQPALGLQVRQLEQELGVLLLERHSRGVSITEPGKLLYERSRTLLASVEETVRDVRALRPAVLETITLGLTPSLTQLLTSNLLIGAQQALPSVSLQIVENLSFVLVDELKRRTLDLAVAYDVTPETGLQCMPWLLEELLLVTAPEPDAPLMRPGLCEEAVTFAEALEHRLVLAGRRDMVRRIVEKTAEEQGLKPQVTFEVQSVQAMKMLVANGMAATIMPFGSAYPEFQSGRLMGRRIRFPTLKRTLFLVRADQKPTDRQQAVYDLVQQNLSELLRVLGPLAHRHEPGELSP